MNEPQNFDDDKTKNINESPNTETESKSAAPSDNVQVSLPRFRGNRIPSLDALLIKYLPPLLVMISVGAVIAQPQAMADAINVLRTQITGNWAWFIILYSLVAVGMCGWLTFAKIGKVRLGGSKARPAYSNFAWYSMLFACGQGIGLIFWSLAQPIMMLNDSAILPSTTANPGENGIVWSYFHWGFTAWAMYCVVAACLGYSYHNLGKTMTFREATVDMLPKSIQRPAGVLIEMLAITATILGLATSFAFAAIQFSSGLSALGAVNNSTTVWIIVIAVFALFTAISTFIGVDKGMKQISELNTILSIALMVGVLILGPTVFIMSNLVQTTGSFFNEFITMSFYVAPETMMKPLASWKDSWNGWWTIFIWCWVISFSPFVAGFIARISRGRTIREFVIGVTIIPSVIVMVWIGIIASAGIYYNQLHDGTISAAISKDAASGLFVMLDYLPIGGTIFTIIATVLVATYFVTSLDSGTYALAEFVDAPKKATAGFRVVLVISIAVVAVVLLSMGDDSVVATVQTGVIIGAFPFTFVILLMIANLFRRLRSRDKSVKKLEKEVNDPKPRKGDEILDEYGIVVGSINDVDDDENTTDSQTVKTN